MDALESVIEIDPVACIYACVEFVSWLTASGTYNFDMLCYEIVCPGSRPNVGKCTVYLSRRLLRLSNGLVCRGEQLSIVCTRHSIYLCM